jgi:hypothetical protein
VSPASIPATSQAQERFGVVLGAAAQQPADPVERVVLAAAVPEGLLLDPADLIHPGESEPGDVEGV